jgi:hypothetical protein
MDKSTHITYRELPAEARMLFFILSLPAFGKHSLVPPKPSDVAATLQQIWDHHGLALADLRDPNRMTTLVAEHLAGLRGAA